MADRRVHPSLPQNPAATQGYYQQPMYAQVPYQYAQSSHYAQAYMQQQQQQPQQPVASTSTWPTATSNAYYAAPAATARARPGDIRCTYKNCIFFGSSSALETHKMDRHLIFPPEYDQRKKESDWDTDPSLKGKVIPIQGTTVNLDDPEVLDAWIAERKKRWPSAGRVEDKKQKMQEAIARGQMTAEDLGLGKRRRPDEPVEEDFSQRGQKAQRGRGRGRGGNFETNTATGRGRGRGKGAELAASTRGKDVGWGNRGRGGLAGSSTRSLVPDDPSDTNSSSDGEDSDSPPEIVSSKRPVEVERPVQPVTPAEPVIKPVHKPAAHQPKPPPRNPFASRPTLLRNLLLPEIRMTVSNLSQAIRFLVDNEFLEGVELKPGDAEATKIQVIDKPSIT